MKEIKDLTKEKTNKRDEREFHPPHFNRLNVSISNSPITAPVDES
jgi:hypothetical protein